MKKLLFLILFVPSLLKAQTNIATLPIFIGNLDSAKVLGSINGLTKNFWGIDFVKSRVKYTDTAAMFAGYPRVNRFTDSIALLRALANSRMTLAEANGLYTPLTRTLTINGTAFDLSANRSWTIAGGSGGNVVDFFASADSTNISTSTDFYGNPANANNVFRVNDKKYYKKSQVDSAITARISTGIVSWMQSRPGYSGDGQKVLTDSLIWVARATGSSASLATPALVATATSSTAVGLTWTNVANESSYLLESSVNNTTWATINSPAVNVTTFTNSGLTPSTLYYYRIKAIGDGNTYLNSGYGSDTATTPAAPVVVGDATIPIAIKTIGASSSGVISAQGSDIVITMGGKVLINEKLAVGADGYIQLQIDDYNTQTSGREMPTSVWMNLSTTAVPVDQFSGAAFKGGLVTTVASNTNGGILTYQNADATYGANLITGLLDRTWCRFVRTAGVWKAFTSIDKITWVERGTFPSFTGDTGEIFFTLFVSGSGKVFNAQTFGTTTY